MPKLSVIVPVYNVGTLIKKCLESLINQSYRDLEIIIVNDGSTDNSIQYLQPYLRYKQIKYVNNDTNRGLGHARNTGITYSKGEYITFVDSDDWVDLDIYNVMLASAKENQSDIVICSVMNEFNNYFCSEERYSYLFSNQITKEKAISLLSRCESNNYMISPVVWNKIYKKELLDCNNIRFLDNSYWEDDVFTFQVFINANCINIVPNVYYHYYQREKSITNNFSKKHIDDLILSFKSLRSYLEQNGIYSDNMQQYSSYFDRAICSLFQMLFRNEPSTSKQREYIIYFYEQFALNFSITEAISYLDITRIKRLFI